MLENFVDLQSETLMREMVNGYNKQDHEKMIKAAHDLKSASGFIGGSRLYYACHLFRVEFDTNTTLRKLDLYQAVIEAVIELKMHARRLLCEHQKTTSIAKADDELTSIP